VCSSDLPGVIAQKLLVGQAVHSPKSTRRRSNRTGKEWNPFL
jgi:hypothetical protein